MSSIPASKTHCARQVHAVTGCLLLLHPALKMHARHAGKQGKAGKLASKASKGKASACCAP